MEYDKRRFAEFEKKENLFERRYNGVPYWQMLRFIVCEGAYSDRIEQSDIVAQRGKWKKMISYCIKLPQILINALIKHFRLKQYDVICVRDKIAPDRFIDYWKMPDTISTLYVDNIIDYQPLKCTDAYSFVLPAFISKVKYIIKKSLNLLEENKEEDSFLKELEKRIIDEFGRSISAKRMKEEILKWIVYDKIHEGYYRKLFTQTGCKAIVVVCYYQNQLYSAYRTAKEMGIRVIEFQHGLLYNHQEYWFEDQRGTNNYTPDYLLTFGPFHASQAKLLPNTKAVDVGFPFQEKQLIRYSAIVTEENTIVIYPQPQKEFDELLNEFVNFMAPKGYRIILKVHPLEATDVKFYYPFLSQNSHLKIITGQDEGIYYWLKLAKHHIMASTTVGVEAVALEDTNICIATFVPHEQTKILIDYGLARGFNTVDDLIALIEYPLNLDKSIARNLFWTPNPTKKVFHFFENLKQQGWPKSEDFTSC